jgi:hypothetical protein
VRNDIVESFSLSHVAVLDGAVSHEHLLGDLYGVRSATMELESTVHENLVDGVVLSHWSIFKKASLRVSAGFLPIRLFTPVLGSLPRERPQGGMSAPLWEERQQYAPTVSMLVTVPARDQEGTARPIHFVLYRVQFEPISFSPQAYKAGATFDYTASALMSSVDETGSPVLDSITGLPSSAIGRILTGDLPEDTMVDAGYVYVEGDADLDGNDDSYDGGTA